MIGQLLQLVLGGVYRLLGDQVADCRVHYSLNHIFSFFHNRVSGLVLSLRWCRFACFAVYYVEVYFVVLLSGQTCVICFPPGVSGYRKLAIGAEKSKECRVYSFIIVVFYGGRAMLEYPPRK